MGMKEGDEVVSYVTAWREMMSTAAAASVLESILLIERRGL